MNDIVRRYHSTSQEIVLVPSWIDRGVFGDDGGSEQYRNTDDNDRSEMKLENGSRKRSRNYHRHNNNNNSNVFHRTTTNLEQIVCDEVRQCDVCSQTVLWSPLKQQSSASSFNGNDNNEASSLLLTPHKESIAEVLPEFVKQHISCTTPLPCSFCMSSSMTEIERTKTLSSSSNDERRWCGSLYCSSNCRTRGEEGCATVFTPTPAITTAVEGVTSSNLTCPRIPPSKLFFCPNRYLVYDAGNNYVDVVNEMIESIASIEQRFKSICGYDNNNNVNNSRIFGIEECALLLTTIIVCTCPNWVCNEFLPLLMKEEGQSSCTAAYSDEESLVEELWAMSKSYDSVCNMLRRNMKETVDTAIAQELQQQLVQDNSTFPSYQEFLRCYLDIKRYCIVRVDLPTHPLVSYATNTILSPTILSDRERGLALEILTSSTSTSASSSESHDYQNDVNNQTSTIQTWRNATHLAHHFSSSNITDEDEEGALSMYIQTKLRKSCFVFSPYLFRRRIHSCVPTSVLTITDHTCEVRENRTYKLSPLKHLVWTELHNIPPGPDELTISKLDSLEGDYKTRSVELKRLMGHDYVCTCGRCRFELELFNTPKGDIPSCSLDTHVLKCVADLAMQQSRFEDALTVYNTILPLCPNEGEILHARAASYLGRASASSFATVGHCRGFFLRAQFLWNEAGSIHECSTHAGIAIEVEKQRVYRTLERSVDVTATNDKVVYTSFLDGKCFLTNDTSAIISIKDCNMVIQVAESYAAAGNSDGWTTSRHYAVPTTDIPLYELTELHTWFYELWTKQIRPLYVDSSNKCL